MYKKKKTNATLFMGIFVKIKIKPFKKESYKNNGNV